MSGRWLDLPPCSRWMGFPSRETVTEPVDEYEFLVPEDKAQVVRQYLITFSEELLASGEQAVLVVVTHSGGPTITYTLS